MSERPCQVRVLDDDGTRVCLCHGAKAKFARGEYFCIAQPVKADWVEVQRQQISKDNGNGTD